MPRQPIIDLRELDVNKVICTIDDIRKVIPHRYEFELLSGILYDDLEQHKIAAFKDVGEDEFWARGHLPGRPIMPGVLIVEAAAQMTCYHRMRWIKDGQFVGFARLDEVSFRGQVQPPCKLILMGELVAMSSRRVVCYAQAFVNSNMVFEGKITGMPLRFDE